MVDKGADLVICQHSHCIGCEERYNKSKIIYGQGNFLFDMDNNEFWANNLLIKINDDFTIEYIPLVKNGASVRSANAEEKEIIMEGFRKRSNEIIMEGFIDKKYKEYANANLNKYLLRLSNASIIFKIINKLFNHKLSSKYLKMKFPLKKRLALLNYLECEPHRELLIQGLKNDNE